MKAMSEGSASGSVLPAWVGRAWRVSRRKWAAMGPWSRASARWAASRRSWGTVGMACGSAPCTRPAPVRCSTPRARRKSGARADRRGRPQKKIIAKDIRATALRSSSTATERGEREGARGVGWRRLRSRGDQAQVTHPSHCPWLVDPQLFSWVQAIIATGCDSLPPLPFSIKSYDTGFYASETSDRTAHRMPVTKGRAS